MTRDRSTNKRIAVGFGKDLTATTEGLLCKVRLRRRRTCRVARYETEALMVRTGCPRSRLLSNRATTSWARNRGLGFYASFRGGQALVYSGVMKMTDRDCQSVRGIVWFGNRRQGK